MAIKLNSPAENVIAGWLGIPIPRPGKQRRRPYRKTTAKRGRKSAPTQGKVAA
jgi:hypothetical protein